MNSKRLVDALKQVPFQILFLALSGLLAILVMIIPEYISKGILWFTSDLNAQHGVGSLIVAIIGIATAMIAMLEFSKKAGVDGAIIAIQAEGSGAKINFIYPIITFGLALVVYTGIAYVLGFDYVAGAVKSLAPYMAGISVNDAFTEVDISLRFTAYIIVTVPQIPMMVIGYILGFRNRLKGARLL